MPERPPVSLRRLPSREPRERVGPRERRPAPAIRPGTTADVPACAQVWARSILDYERRLRPGAIAGDLAPVTRLIEHLHHTDPERFWVATRPAPPEAAGGPGTDDDPPRNGAELVVGFSAATVRGPLWFLALLFVMPEEQAQGLGHRLLARCGPGGRLPGETGAEPSGPADTPIPAIHATVADSVQPISNALYARAGLVPRLPAYRIVGRPAGTIPALPEGIRMERLIGGDAAAAAEGALAEIDRSVLGRTRPADHDYFRRDGRLGFLFRSPDGRPLAYGYASPVGRIGPVAVIERDLLVPVVFRLLAAVEPRGASAITVTGATPELFAALLRAGLRLDGFPALLCWDRPFADLERYCLASYALP